MDVGPSRTAWRVALRRAAHQLFDEPLVFEDPLALRIVGPDAVAAICEARAEYDAPAARRLRLFLAARSRYAEDALARSGASQYVVLGAGFDTSAYRFVGRRSFEVDHPASQAAKREALAAAGIAIPASLSFAPVDFERESLEDGLARAGFDLAAPTFFSWLGVVPYLTRDAIASTIAFIAARPAGTEVVFDFAVPESLLSPAQRAARAELAARVAAAGEPFQTYFEPDEIRAWPGFTAQIVDNRIAHLTRA